MWTDVVIGTGDRGNNALASEYERGHDAKAYEIRRVLGIEP